MLDAFAQMPVSVEFAQRASPVAVQKVMEIAQTKRSLVADLTNRT